MTLLLVQHGSRLRADNHVRSRQDLAGSRFIGIGAYDAAPVRQHAGLNDRVASGTGNHEIAGAASRRGEAETPHDVALSDDLHSKLSELDHALLILSSNRECAAVILPDELDQDFAPLSHAKK